MLGLTAVSEAPVSDLGTTTASVRVAYTEPPDTVAILVGVNANFTQVAYTEPADTVAIAVQPVVPLDLAVAYTEPPDSFAIYGPLAPPPVRERTYTRRPLGWSFEPEITIVKDRPGPLRILEFNGWMS